MEGRKVEEGKKKAKEIKLSATKKKCLFLKEGGWN